MVNIKPMRDMILLKKEGSEVTTKSGIILTKTIDPNKPRLEYGIVLDVGPDCKSKKDDKLIFMYRAGSTVEEHEDGNIILLKETDVLGVCL